jgi:Arc/MetJ-type ribon-helix-helix transcriptional regulator
MQITLPPEAQAIIERDIESGRYATQEEVIVDALRHLDVDAYVYDAMSDPKVLEAIAQDDRGESREFTEDVMNELLERARENLRPGKAIPDDLKY